MVGYGNKRQTLVTFQLGGQQYALAASCVERVIAMAQVDCPPSAPKLLAGFLNMEDVAVPVIHLHSLFRLPQTTVRLWTPLVMVRTSTLRLALLVDKVNRMLVVDEHTVLPVPQGHALNDCVEAVVRWDEDSALVLSPERLLLQQESQTITELQQLAQQRLCELEGGGA